MTRPMVGLEGREPMAHMASPMVHLFAVDGSSLEKGLVVREVLKQVALALRMEWKRKDGREQGEQSGGGRGGRKIRGLAQRIGFLVYGGNSIVVPHWQKKRKRMNSRENIDNEENLEEWEMQVSFMMDCTKDPYCPLPLNAWTYSVGEEEGEEGRLEEEAPLEYFMKALDAIPTIVQTMIPNSNGSNTRGGGESVRGVGGDGMIPQPPPPLPSTNATAQQPSHMNCGGAALAVLVHAIESDPSVSGGRGTLLTDSRISHGVGSIVDRQGTTCSQYTRSNTELSLLTPTQDEKGSSGSSSAGKSNGRCKACGTFFQELETKCLKENISLSIVYTSPLGQELGSGSVGRQYVDVATLGRLCHKTCGKFKWLKVEDGDVLVEGGVEKDGTYAHQLKEELV